MSTTAKAALPFTEHNADETTTICLIHGAFSSCKEWDGVVRCIKDYHLLLPDLPEHGKAADLSIKFSAESAADLIANLIRQHAKNGKAYVVGMSIGGHVAVQLITCYPDVVDEAAFVTGYSVWESLNTAFVARALMLEQRIGIIFSSFSTEKKLAFTFELCRKIAATITTENWPKPWPARTLFIAAGKNAPMTNIRDRTVNQVHLRDIGRQRNQLTAAYTNPIIPHPWNSTHPELFADTMLAWLRKTSLPNGFVEL